MSINSLIIVLQRFHIVSITNQIIFVKNMCLQCCVGRLRSFFRCDCQQKTQNSHREFQNQLERIYRKQPFLIHMNHLLEQAPTAINLRILYRHCERNEATQGPVLRTTGLLRFARNDELGAANSLTSMTVEQTPC